jgi:NAD(P)H-flavin reductase
MSLADSCPAAIPTAPAGDPWRSHTVRIEQIIEEIPGVRTYDLRFLDQGMAREYRFAPGQFNMLHMPGIGEAAISISSDPAEPAQLAHTVRAVGNVTDALARMQPGETLMLRGPYGQPWPVASRTGRDMVLVAGGLGLASQRAAILELAACSTPVSIEPGGRRASWCGRLWIPPQESTGLRRPAGMAVRGL